MSTSSPNHSEHSLSSSITHAGVDHEKGVDVDIGIRIKEGVLIVDWNGSDDPSNPMNWSTRKRWIITIIVSVYTFCAALPSSMIAPGTAQLAEDFGLSNKTVQAMVTSIFLLAFALGPLVFGPLSEMFGRSTVLLSGNLFFIIWNTVSGFAQTTPQIIIFRFLAGLGASIPVNLGQTLLGDMWEDETRGRVTSIYSIMPGLSPVVGPLIGSWIADRTSWRWIFWSVSISYAVAMVGHLFLPETYAPVLLERKAKRILKSLAHQPPKSEKISGGVIGLYNDEPVMRVKTVYDGENRSFRKIFGQALSRPFIMFWHEPIIQLLGAYFAFVYGLLYLFLTTISSTFKGVYGQSLGISGLNYIALGIGILIASQVVAYIMDPMYAYYTKRNSGVKRPEYRLPPMVLGSLLLPIGMLLSGWAAEKHIHWMVSDIGLMFFGMGQIINFQCILIYVVDTFTLYSASAIAAVTFMRCITAFGFPLFAPALYNSLGYGKGNTLLAGLALLIGLPSPILLWIYGEKIRSASRHTEKQV